MSLSPILPADRQGSVIEPAQRPSRNRRVPAAPFPVHYPAHAVELDASQRHAELFYLQKQIQTQTPMVIVLEDGEQVEGCIEWYDRNSLKVRGKTKTLIYKSAIKYMYKHGDMGR
jgi:sRNA-binding regulator protein Hfq